jgi:lysophospholipase L1-like esterase
MKRAVFAGMTLAIPLVFLVVATAVFLPRLEASLRPLLFQYMASNLSDEERKAIYDQIARGTSFWDAIADPDVAGLGQPNRTVTDAGAVVHINNAGMRGARDFAPKPEGTFRIICLGDSFVFGMGGLEEDRFCDQLAAFYAEHGVRVHGQPIETLALGLPGWTLAQSTTYLTTRITSYDPDLILVLSVANDITDNYGITGTGAFTASFSPEQRALGSAVFSDDINRYFGDKGAMRAALSADLSPASRARWDKAMERLKRLTELQRSRGKQILVSMLAWGRTDRPDPYVATFQYHFARAGLSGPLVTASFLPGRRTMLPHDGHPNKLGHQLLRDQYIHALHRLGWVPVPATNLPRLLRETPVRLDPLPDASGYNDFRQSYLPYIGETIDFARLRPAQSRAFLGGVIPESRDPAHAVEAMPWASLRATFLLRRPTDSPLKGVEVDFEIPARPELFPFSLKLLVDGIQAAELHLTGRNETGRYRISGTATAPPFHGPVVEVTLETSSYFSTLDDSRMKSYRLVRARAF